jgi:hypothetical protein
LASYPDQGVAFAVVVGRVGTFRWVLRPKEIHYFDLEGQVEIHYFDLEGQVEVVVALLGNCLLLLVAVALP